MDKLLIISPGALPIPAVKGGAIENITQFLIDENEKNHKYDITLITIKEPNAIKLQKKYTKTKFINIRTKRNLFLKIFDRVLQKLKLKNPIIHKTYEEKVIKYLCNNNIFDKILVENCFKLLLNYNLNAFNGDKYYHAHYDDINVDTDERTKNALLKNCLAYKYFIGVSNFIVNRINELLQGVVPSISIPIAIDIEKFKVLDGSELKKVKNSINKDNKKIIMYAGRMVREKGVLELIKAFKLLDCKKDVRLVLVGGATYSEDSVTEYIKDLHLEAQGEDVIFTGYVNYANIKYYFSNADVFCLPTLYVEEAAGAVLLEARVAGATIVASNAGGIPEYVDEKGILVFRDNNYICNLAKALSHALELEKAEDDGILYYDKDRFASDVFNLIRR